jgi:hypothetical protein
MQYAEIKDSVVVSIMLNHTSGRVPVPDNVVCGMIQKADGTFTNPVPTQSQLMDRVRFQRNQLLAQSDWMAVSDRVMTQAQIDYRQALRDLPQTADPQLDEQGNLTNVTWPTYE